MAFAHARCGMVEPSKSKISLFLSTTMKGRIMKISAKVTGFAALIISMSLCAPIAQARNTPHYLPIGSVIEMGRVRGELGGDIKLYFANQPHPPTKAVLRRGIVTNKKTNSINKTDRQACKWVMLSALSQLQQAARDRGGNAVVNIESYYRKRPFRSMNRFECHAGRVVAGVALKGDIVRLGY